MATNITKLKGSKGAPPPADETPDVIAEDKRSEKEALRPLQGVGVDTTGQDLA